MAPNDYFEQKKLARKLFGQCIKRPQEDRRFLLQRRKINFGYRRAPEPDDYRENLDSWSLPMGLLQSAKDSPPPSPTFSSTFIQNPDEFRQMMDIIKSVNVISLDLEANGEDSFMGMTCLLQLGTVKGTYVVDPFTLDDQIINELRDYLQRLDILIIMHGCANDVRWLKRDFGIYPVAVIDVQLIYQKMHRGDLTGYDIILKELVPSLHSKDNMKKICQKSDWHMRPLPAALINYAAMDAYGLIYIWEEFKKLDPDGYYIIKAAKETKKLLKGNYGKPGKTFEQEQKSMRKSVKLSKEQEESLRTLWEFRNFHAQAVDISPPALMSMSTLVQLVKRSPTQEIEIKSIVQSHHDYLKKSYGTMLKLLKEGKPFWEKIQKTTCNNCLRTGHAAFACWEAYSNENIKRYYQLHPDLKTKRNKKKHDNYKKNVKARKECEQQTE